VDETTDKEKAGNSPACPDLYSLIFRLTIYIAQTLSILTVCFERGAKVRPDLSLGMFSTLMLTLFLSDKSIVMELIIFSDTNLDYFILIWPIYERIYYSQI
jgi:hypothetical protein